MYQKKEERICVLSCWKAWSRSWIGTEEVQLHVASDLEQKVPHFLSYLFRCPSWRLLCKCPSVLHFHFLSRLMLCSYGWDMP